MNVKPTGADCNEIFFENIFLYVIFATPKNRYMNRFLLISVLLFAVSTVYAQKDEKQSLDFLKGQSQLNVVFDYSSVQIDGMPLEAFFDKKSTKDKKRNNWLEYWNGELKERIYQTFCKNANDEAASKTGVTCGNFPEAKYTAIIKMIKIDDDGEFVALVSFKEQGSDASLYSTKIEGSEGNGKFDECIDEAYEDGGENFGELLKKKLK
jgi:hypothetical protein